MARFYKKSHLKKGKSPGSLIFIGTQKVDQATFSLIAFGPDNLEEQLLAQISDAKAYAETDLTAWINITGLHDTELVRECGELFNIHPLILEDILSTGQRAKALEVDDTIYIVLKMLSFEPDKREVAAEQLSIVLYKNFVITFQEQPGDTFESVRERIRGGKGRIRTMGPDYLTYALLDTIVDHYIHTVEIIGEQIEELELRILDEEFKGLPAVINGYKQELHFLSKVIRPVKGLSFDLQKLVPDSGRFNKRLLPFLKDLDDHLTHVLESLETFRELTSDYLAQYHMEMSARLNDILRVLTIFSVIFIPITFLAGVYGMNFEVFPELAWRWAYPAFWLFVVSAVGGMLWYFRRKGWM